MRTNEKSKKIVSPKTLYVWDLADTLFNDVWNKERTGFTTYADWLQHRLNKKLSQISAWEYENNYKIPYCAGWYFNLDIKPGFRQTLSWTKNNETFSTGNQAQMTWRGRYLDKKYHFKLKKYFKKLNSTFDYGDTNVKSLAMFEAYLKGKYKEGYRAVVYSDNQLGNLKFFKAAVDKCRKILPDLGLRLYHVLNNQQGIKDKKWYFSVGTLFDLLKNEKKIKKY
ncbi:MAG: hypothetical protein WC456_00480 [Patescibacteria group bacterium]